MWKKWLFIDLIEVASVFATVETFKTVQNDIHTLTHAKHSICVKRRNY